MEGKKRERQAQTHTHRGSAGSSIRPGMEERALPYEPGFIGGDENGGTCEPPATASFLPPGGTHTRAPHTHTLRSTHARTRQRGDKGTQTLARVGRYMPSRAHVHTSTNTRGHTLPGAAGGAGVAPAVKAGASHTLCDVACRSAIVSFCIALRWRRHAFFATARVIPSGSNTCDKRTQKGAATRHNKADKLIHTPRHRCTHHQ